MGRAARESCQRERDWKEQNFWKELPMLNPGQDICCLHPLLTRLLPVADPIAILSAGKWEFTMKINFLAKNPAHIILSVPTLMEQGYKKNPEHPQHTWFLLFHWSIPNPTHSPSRAQGRCNDKLPSSSRVRCQPLATFVCTQIWQSHSSECDTLFGKWDVHGSSTNNSCLSFSKETKACIRNWLFLASIRHIIYQQTGSEVASISSPSKESCTGSYL